MSRYTITSTVFLVVFLGSLSLDGVWNIPVYWYVSVVVVYLALNAYGATVLSAQYFVSVRSRSLPNDKFIAISFDDGPIPGHTEKILAILKQHHVPATFFCIGHRVQRHPDLLKQIHAEGHLIGNHSYSHKKTFDLLSANRVANELTDTNAVIGENIGLMPKFFRPPFGVTNPMIAKAVTKKNLTVIGWSVRSFDTVTKDKQKLFSRVTRLMKGGDIILFHDYCDVTIAILPELIDYASRLGLKFVRIDELLKEKGYA